MISQVQERDLPWVRETLSRAGGRELIFSPWGGGVAQTCILYAAHNGDVDMCRLLIR